MKLDGKTAIVTGASRGIGKALAIGFAQEGACVVVAARSVLKNDKKIEGTIYETTEAIKDSVGRAIPIRCDVADEASVIAMVKTAVTKFGHIDVLVNNAGVALPPSRCGNDPQALGNSAPGELDRGVHMHQSGYCPT